MSQPIVQVLLATYNGERFLREQIDSILAQTYTPLTILASDDGSRDNTVAILADYAQHFPTRFILTPATAPTGSPQQNFLKLMQASTAQYVAFADQDDVWLPEKIAAEMAAMRSLEQQHGTQTPLLVFTGLKLVDESLTILHESMWVQQRIDPTNIHRFARIIASNVATGCTELFNRPLLDLALSMPPEAHIHDWWVAILAAGFGASAIVQQPTILYRQHSRNTLSEVLAAPPAGMPNWRNHANRRAKWEVSERQAAALLRLHGSDLTPDKRRTLEGFLRCGSHLNRIVRVLTWLRYGFFINGGPRQNLAILWYLWDMKAAKAATR